MTDTIKILQPSGVIDRSSGSELQEAIIETANAGAKIVLINCKDVMFIDSSGLGTLVSAFKAIQQVGSRLSFCSINDQVRILFELTSLNEIFEVFPDENIFAEVVNK